MNEFYFVSVIVPVYNQNEVFVKNLESFFEQTYPKDRYEIIVVDDGSTDGLLDSIREIPENHGIHLKYFFQPHQGPAAARNLGIQNAQGKIVAFTDADCMVSENWVEEISKGYTDDRVAGVGGTTKAIVTKSMVSQYCAYVKMNGEPARSGADITYIITANASFQKECLALIRGFDECYKFPGGEDLDACYRLKKKGYIFKHNQKAIVHNPNKQKLKELLKSYFYYGIGESFLMLRMQAKEDLTSVKRLRRILYFIKVFFKCSFMFIKTVICICKFPFGIMLHYSEGLSLSRGFTYAFLDRAKKTVFQIGLIIGYIMGQFKGFKRYDFGESNKKNISQ